MTEPKILANMVLDQIRRNPETHDQGVWRCNSGMCFAGWTTALAGKKFILDDYQLAYSYDDDVPLGDDHYSLTDEQISQLDSAAYSVDSLSTFVYDDDGYPAHQLINTYSLDLFDIDPNAKIRTIQESAKILLGLDSRDAGTLFDSDNSLRDLEGMVEEIYS